MLIYNFLENNKIHFEINKKLKILYNKTKNLYQTFTRTIFFVIKNKERIKK